MKVWCWAVFLLLCTEIQSQGTTVSCIICREPLGSSNKITSSKGLLSAYRDKCIPKQSENSSACYFIVSIDHDRKDMVAHLTDDNPFPIETELDGLFIRTQLNFFELDHEATTMLVYKCSTPLLHCNYLLFDYINRKKLLDVDIIQRYGDTWVDAIDMRLRSSELPVSRQCWVTGHEEAQLCHGDEKMCAFERLSHQRCELGLETGLMIDTAITTSNHRSELISFRCDSDECNSFETLESINKTIRPSYETKKLVWPVEFTEERSSTTPKPTTSTLPTSE
jgi:hypothetical protein